MGSLKGFVPVTPPVKGKGAESTAAPRAIDMVTPWPVRDWAPEVAPDEAAAMRTALERGNVLHFSALAFPLDARERRFLDARWSDGKTKNINLRANEANVRGAVGDPADLRDLAALIRRYADAAEQLVRTLFPAYVPYLKRAGTSLRPAEIAGRAVSWRKDDTRLHVDAFPSNPLQGQRLLRVFHNVDPDAPRVWRIGEPFGDFARRFVPQTHGMLPGQAWLMHRLHITKRPRSEYDHRMLQLHDLYQGGRRVSAHRPAADLRIRAGRDLGGVQRPGAACGHARPGDDGADLLPGSRRHCRPHAFARGRAVAHARQADAAGAALTRTAVARRGGRCAAARPEVSRRPCRSGT